MKNWFSNCFPLLYTIHHVSIVTRSAFADILVPWILCKGPTWPRKKMKFIFFHIFYFNSKGSYQIASIFDMQIIIKERVDVNQDGPSLIIEPPPGPQIAKDVKCFHIWKTYYPLLFLVVHMSTVWWGLHDTLVPLDSTYASPGPPKMETKLWKMFIRLLQYFTCCWEDSFGVKSICWALEAYKMFIMSSVDQCVLIWGDRGIHLWLRATEQSSCSRLL